jgi:hypothetical protein
MITNIGLYDRIFRLLVGGGLLFVLYQIPNLEWAAVGLVPLATGFFGWCPAYAAFGLRTCRKENQRRFPLEGDVS